MIDAIRTYYPLGGPRAVLALARHKVFKNHPDISVRVQGIRFPIHIRVHTSDLHALRQVLIEREYEIPFAVRPDVIIDGGANIGLTSVFFANRYPNARILAVEPEPSNFRMLAKNAKPYKSITPILGALWHRPGTLALSSVEEFGHWGVRVSETESRCVAAALTMPELMQRCEINFIDILKLDIEGAEKEVLGSSGPWIGKVRMIVIETHDRLKSGCSEAFESAAAAFSERFTQGGTTFAIRAGDVSGGPDNAPRPQTHEEGGNKSSAA